MRRTIVLTVLSIATLGCSCQIKDLVPQEFIVRQMMVFSHEGPLIVQSYATDEPTLAYRGDIYDTATALLHLLRQDDIQNARSLADALVFLQDRDQNPDGRLHAAYWPNNLLDPQGRYTSIYAPDIAPGNMAWAAIALSHFYRATGEQQYLTAALRIAAWIQTYCRKEDTVGGYSGGLLGWTYQAVNWRATEHNVDVYVMAKCLATLTGDPNYTSMAQHAQAFVQGMFDPNQGCYMTGTMGDQGVQINPRPIPADAQSWSVLASIDDPIRLAQALRWVLDHLLITETCGERTYTGIKFSTEGNHIQSEVTGGVAAAARLLGWIDEADMLLNALDEIKKYAGDPNNGGVPATPCPEGASTGYGSTYPLLSHVASSAWMGFAAMMKCNLAMNPLEPLSEASGGSSVVPAP